MGSTRIRFLIVALLVNLFAIGMAAFLNYFKFKATLAHAVESRIVVLGRGIESSLQASLALGIALADTASAPGLLARERLSDPTILAIDVFDDRGSILYSTEAGRTERAVPSEWLRSAAGARNASWRVEERGAYIAGIPVTNSFGLTVGHVALSYSRAEVDAVAATVGREVAFKAFAAFAAVAVVLPFILFFVMRRFLHDLRAAEAVLDGIDSPDWKPMATTDTGSLAGAVAAAARTLKAADRGLALLKAKVDGAR